jgi:hypothetical protein
MKKKITKTKKKVKGSVDFSSHERPHLSLLLVDITKIHFDLSKSHVKKEIARPAAGKKIAQTTLCNPSQ